MKIGFCTYFCIIGIVFCDEDSNGQLIKVEQGLIRGHYKTSYNGRIYSAFEGIPYAQPPVGDLRFAEPQPAESWSGELIANKSSYMCMQLIPMLGSPQGTEDCLYAYVYVPLEQINGEENLDVVVHIHGGAFMLGSPQIMAGPDYIMDTNVIYVTFNYRLGILGFLSTEDSVVSGNNGLKDQSLALKWIKNNIKNFGGNANSITITGLSAGGSSVHYHYLTPLSRGLFNRGFSQSGTALQSWALTENPLSNAKVVAAEMKCPTGSTVDMVECLKYKSVKKLVKSITVLFVAIEGVPFTPFGPVVEKGPNAFISEHPYKILKNGDVYDVPWVTSNVKHEGIIPVGFFEMFGKLQELNNHWYEIMPYALDINNTVDVTEWSSVVDKMTKYYITKRPVTKDNIYELVQMFTDRVFLIDTEKALRLHAKAVNSPVYYYSFSYLLEQAHLFQNFKDGAAHSDDGRLLFKLILSPHKLPKNDEKIMRRFLNFLTTFAATGKPKFNNNVEWIPIDKTTEDIHSLNIASADDIEMKTLKELGPTSFYESLPIMENDKLF